jgi:uncharacterized protein (DUF427 family)
MTIEESVWDYPRPPAIEKTDKRIKVVYNGIVIVDTLNAYHILETSHPPVYYIPQRDIDMTYLSPNSHQTFCEFKGYAHYWTIAVNCKTEINAAWSYPNPTPKYQPIQDHLAFYAGKMEACFVDNEQVTPQASEFYGGWITTGIRGPFKGSAKK